MKRLTEEQAQTLYNHLKLSDHPDDIFLMTLFETGARISEILPLGVDALNGGNLQFQGLKGSQGREITLSPCLISKLRSLPRGARFFRNHASLKTNRVFYFRYARKVGAEILGTTLTPHMLRHTAISRLYVATKDLLLTQQWSGHACITSTRRYVHVDLKDQANKIMQEILAG